MITLSVLEGHFYIASLFMCDFFSYFGASRGPSASAEVIIYVQNNWRYGLKAIAMLIRLYTYRHRWTSFMRLIFVSLRLRRCSVYVTGLYLCECDQSCVMGICQCESTVYACTSRGRALRERSRERVYFP